MTTDALTTTAGHPVLGEGWTLDEILAGVPVEVPSDE